MEIFKLKITDGKHWLAKPWAILSIPHLSTIENLASNLIFPFTGFCTVQRSNRNSDHSTFFT